MRVGLVAVHGDGRRVVEGAEHLHGERVPAHLSVLLRDTHLPPRTLLAPLEPEEEEEEERSRSGQGDEEDGKRCVRHLLMALKYFCR